MTKVVPFLRVLCSAVDRVQSDDCDLCDLWVTIRDVKVNFFSKFGKTFSLIPGANGCVSSST